ncbi:MAG: cadherin-like domain-containing protein, partial [Anaerolineales bacterium]|nr:cadherin-like domain-containing protein [Anaerolineales bacterium]
MNSGVEDIYLEPGQAILGQLGFYGNDTEVHPPLDNSPAINAADYAPCLPTDQTGASRSGCDIGAYERIDASELVLTKTASDEEVLPGDSLTYEITVENTGDFTVTNITLMDVIPAEFLSPVVITSTIITETSGAPDYEWELPDLGAGDSVVIQIEGTVEDMIPTQVITNTASVTGDADVYSRLEHAVPVTVLNVAPDAVNDTPAAVDEGTVIMVDALDNDTDDNGDTLTIVAVGAASNGATATDGAMITYTPTLHFFGTDSFTYTVSDGNGGSDTAMVTVELNSVNDPPYFASTPITSANVGLLYSYTAVGADPDAGDTYTVTVNTLPAWLGFTDNGNGSVTITGTAALGDIGPHAVELEVEDEAGLTTTQSFTVTVINTNSPPSFTSSPVLTATIGDLYSYMVMATDPNTGDALTINALTLPSWLSFADNGDGTAVISGTATIAQVGEYAVELEVSDSISQTATQAYTVTVINRAPTFDSTPVMMVTAGKVYTYNISASDLDAGDVITITEGSLPSWLSFMDNGDGTAVLTGMPSVSDVGDYGIALQVEDSFGLTDTQSFTLTVNENVAPTFTSSPVLVAEVDSLYTYSITAEDMDGDSLTITGTYPSWLTLTDNGDGTATLSGTPSAANVGPDSVALEVSDSVGQTDI